MDLTLLTKITGLALADAVNPCAFAVLLMVLMTVLLKDPTKRKKALYTGLSFAAAIYIGYIIYGFIIIQLFNAFNIWVRSNIETLYAAFGILAMILGALNIRDFFNYKKGGIATEMPMSWRPKVKKLIDGIASPKGAFVIGIFVTLFLLPCTMGPYVIASGMLAEKGLLVALPWLLYYNALFVLPMIGITLMVYFGFRRVEEISGWKERNIRYMHLIAGLLLFIIGTGLLLRWW